MLSASSRSDLPVLSLSSCLNSTNDSLSGQVNDSWQYTCVTMDMVHTDSGYNKWQRCHSRLYPSRSWYSIKRPRRDVRLSWPSWLRWYTRLKTATHPSTNRARRALTSSMRRTPLTTTPRRHIHVTYHYATSPMFDDTADIMNRTNTEQSHVNRNSKIKQ